MRLDRKNIPWAILVGVGTVATGVLYLANFHPDLLPFTIDLPRRFFGESPPVRATFGGTPLGLLYGILAFLIFLFASALGIRKKRRLWPIGNVQTWLRAHIWLTIFTIPLVLYHCGFHWGGQQTTWLLVLYIFVMGSGFVGLALQQFMPALMKDKLPREVVFEQIPHIRHRIFEATLELRRDLRAAERKTVQPPAVEAFPVSAGAATMRATLPVAAVEDDPSISVLGEFLDNECLPYLRSRRGKRFRLGDQKTSDDIFRLLKLNVTDKWRPKVEELQTWCDDRRVMDVQVRLHHWLHAWLLIHVPTSFALLVFTAWHAWVAVRFLVSTP